MSFDASSARGDLILTRITKEYGDFKAVDDLSLTIPKGSFFALLGPSGCGKTTTLRMIAGLEEPTIGSIHLGETDITTTKPYQRPINTVFQNYALFPHLTIFENIAFGLRRRGIKDVDAEVNKVLNLVELPHLAGRKPTQLSGGQQQRIALARAIVNRPALLLLDEPLGALDALTREKMQSLVLELWKETGKTIMIITHSVEEALLLGERLFVMAPRPGRIHKEYRLPFAEQGLKQSLRDIKQDSKFSEIREEILTMIWNMEEEIMGGV